MTEANITSSCRIELDAVDRARLDRMAGERGLSADELAERLVHGALAQASANALEPLLGPASPSPGRGH